MNKHIKKTVCKEFLFCYLLVSALVTSKDPKKMLFPMLFLL